VLWIVDCPDYRSSSLLYHSGSTAGLKDSSCSELCSPGYHCPEASTSPTQLECAVLARTGTFDSSIAVAAKALQPVVSLS
jgi:hypothetical protein